MTRSIKRIPRRVLLPLALFAAAGVAATACGGDGDDSPYSATPARTATAAAPAQSAPTVTAAATPASGAATPAAAAALKVADAPGIGKILTDGAGMTLYVFKNDTPGNGKSACVGGCATAWPPLVTSAAPAKAAEAAGDVATIKRDDGSTQVTYRGLPLYHFAGDTKPGDTTGQGVGGVWTAAAP